MSHDSLLPKSGPDNPRPGRSGREGRGITYRCVHTARKVEVSSRLRSLLLKRWVGCSLCTPWMERAVTACRGPTATSMVVQVTVQGTWENMIETCYPPSNVWLVED